MRTTLTIDDDVAARIEMLRAERSQGLKTIINDLLRRGLDADERATEPEMPEFPTYSLGVARCEVRRVGDVLELLDSHDLIDGGRRDAR